MIRLIDSRTRFSLITVQLAYVANSAGHLASVQTIGLDALVGRFEQPCFRRVPTIEAAVRPVSRPSSAFFCSSSFGHGTELPYVFGFPPIGLLAKYEPPDIAAVHERIEEQIQAYWTNFAKTGDPNESDLPHWPSFSIRNQRLLETGDTFVVADVPDAQAMQLLYELHTERR